MSIESQESILSTRQEKRRLALVVGVNGKSVPGQDTLKYAEQDAVDLAHALRDCGYELFFRSPLVGERATTEQVKKAVLALAKAITNDDLVVFFFSGHGVFKVLSDSVEDIYLVTDDFEESDLDIDSHAHLSIRWLREVLFCRKKAADILLILECCYAGNGGQMGTDPYLENILKQFKFYYGDSPPAGEIPARALRTLLAATLPDRVAMESDGHGLMAGNLLQALRGEFEEAFDANHKDCISYTSLLSYLEKHMPPEQRPRSYGASGQMILAYYPGRVAQLRQEERQAEREQRLHAMIFDDAEFLRDRLSSFVGREKEVDEVRGKIAHLLQTGGYLTIVGPAGQGKSSLIACLIDQDSQKERLEGIAYHFIPLDPGFDYQFTILRKLMARFILKYDLPDFYLDGQTTAALRDYFPVVLKQIADKGQCEVIYIDGLDQLEEAGASADLKGKRDLSFLPQTVPSGIVFVLGTRPSDTLAPLRLKKPHITYQLLNLSRADFDAILSHRGVRLELWLVDQFYQKLSGNALFLDLLAKELAIRDPITAVEVEMLIQRLAANPENLFGLAIERHSQHWRLWERVLKPLLGILLVAREPLGLMQLKQILNLHQPHSIDNNQLIEGVTRLGGLLISDGQKRYTLFHLKLRDYLSGREEEADDQKLSGRIGLFDVEDRERFHGWLADWCEQGDLTHIWLDSNDESEQGRRTYTRYHYITHLYSARRWSRLFEVLDEMHYGQAKIHWDPSTRLFAQDLELGQLAASWEEYTYKEARRMLPSFWRYTLLRCNLASRAGRYTDEAFQLLVMLGREQEAIGLAELLTDEKRKANSLSKIALQLRDQAAPQAAWFGLLLRAEQVALGIQSGSEQAEVMGKLGKAFAQTQRWQQAEAIISRIVDSSQQARALCKLGEALAQAGETERALQVWQQAEAVISYMEGSSLPAEAYWKIEALCQLGRALARAQQWQRAEIVISRIGAGIPQSDTLQELLRMLIQAQQWQQAEALISRMEYTRLQAEVLSWLGQALAREGKLEWAAQVWQRAEAAISRLADSYQQAETLCELGEALVQAGKPEWAAQIWQRAGAVISRIVDSSIWKFWALRELGLTLTQVGESEQAAQVWQQAEALISRMADSFQRAVALCELGEALVQAQVWQRAEETISRVENNLLQAMAWRKLGEALLQVGESERALQVWRRAEAAISHAEDDSQRVQALRELGKTLIQAQQWQCAEAVISRMKNSDEQPEALCELGEALAQAHQWQYAEAVISRIVDSSQQAWALCKLGEALAQAGESERAFQVWQQAEAVISYMEGSSQQARAWSELGEALARDSKPEWAIQIWQRAEAAISRIVDSSQQAWALCKLGEALAQAGESERALQVWQQAEAVISCMEDGTSGISILGKLGEDLTQAKHWEQAEVVISRMPVAWQAKAFCALGEALAQVGESERALQVWQQAEAVISRIEDNFGQAWALSELARMLTQAKQWQQVEAVISRMVDSRQQAKALREFGHAMARAGRYHDLLLLIRRFWILTRTRDEALEVFNLATHFIQQHTPLGKALFEEFSWVDAFLAGEKGNTTEVTAY